MAALVSNGPMIAVSLIKHGFLLSRHESHHWSSLTDNQPIFSSKAEKSTDHRHRLLLRELALFTAVKLGLEGE